MINIYARLGDLGVSESVCPALAEFKAAANSFVRDGVGCSGRLALAEIGRVLRYTLSTRPHVVSSATLEVLKVKKTSQ